MWIGLVKQALRNPYCVSEMFWSTCVARAAWSIQATSLYWTLEREMGLCLAGVAASPEPLKIMNT